MNYFKELKTRVFRTKYVLGALLGLYVSLIAFPNDDVTPWAVEPRTLAPDDSIFYKDINTNDLHTTMVLDSLMRYDVNSKVNFDNDMLIAKIAYYSDGSLAEDMGSVINKAIFTKPGFLTNISKNNLYYFGAIYILYYELFVFDVDQGTFEDILHRYMNSLPELVSVDEKRALSNAFVIIHNQIKDIDQTVK